MSAIINDPYAGQTKVENPEQPLNVQSNKGFVLKPGESTTISTCWGSTRVRVVNSSSAVGQFWLRAGIHPVEEHEIAGMTSQIHDRMFGPFGAFVGNNGKVSLYFETSC